MADLKKLTKAISAMLGKAPEKLPPPGQIADQLAKEEAQAWKAGEFSRIVEPPRVTSVGRNFARYHLENLEAEARRNPTRENIQRLEEARLDLIGKVEYNPRPFTEEMQAAIDRLEAFGGPKTVKDFEAELRANPTIENLNKLEEAKRSSAVSSESRPSVLEGSEKTKIMEPEAPAESSRLLTPEELQDKTQILEPEVSKKPRIIPVKKTDPKKLLGLAGVAAGAGMLGGEDEAEAAVKGSPKALQNIAEKFGRQIRNWTESVVPAARKGLENVLDTDPTGLARKETLRRMAKYGKVVFNPETQEHEFLLFRGDKPDFLEKQKFKSEPLSWTPDVNIASGFDNEIFQTRLPSSKIGAFFNVIPTKQGLEGFKHEKEVISKPFDNPVVPYLKPQPTFIKEINKRISKGESPSFSFFKNPDYREVVAGKNFDLTKKMAANAHKTMAKAEGERLALIVKKGEELPSIKNFFNEVSSNNLPDAVREFKDSFKKAANKNKIEPFSANWAEKIIDNAAVDNIIQRMGMELWETPYIKRNFDGRLNVFKSFKNDFPEYSKKLDAHFVQDELTELIEEHGSLPYFYKRIEQLDPYIHSESVDNSVYNKLINLAYSGYANDVQDMLTYFAKKEIQPPNRPQARQFERFGVQLPTKFVPEAPSLSAAKTLIRSVSSNDFSMWGKNIEISNFLSEGGFANLEKNKAELLKELNNNATKDVSPEQMREAENIIEQHANRLAEVALITETSPAKNINEINSVFDKIKKQAPSQASTIDSMYRDYVGTHLFNLVRLNRPQEAQSEIKAIQETMSPSDFNAIKKHMLEGVVEYNKDDSRRSEWVDFLNRHFGGIDNITDDENLKEAVLNPIFGMGAAAVGGAALAEKDAQASSDPTLEATRDPAALVPRKFIEKALKNSSSGNEVNFNKFFNTTFDKAGGVLGPNAGPVSSEMLNHLLLERTGLPESKMKEAAFTAYPELSRLPVIEDNNLGSYGSFRAVKRNLENDNVVVNPRSAAISYNPTLTGDSQLASTLAHEGEHFRSFLNSPEKWAKETRVYASTPEQQLANLQSVINSLPEPRRSTVFKEIMRGTNPQTLLTPEEQLARASFNHNSFYPLNYELEKSKELINSGIIKPTTSEIDNAIKNRQSEFSNNKKTGAGIAGAVAAMAAGASPSANAQEPSKNEEPSSLYKTESQRYYDLRKLYGQIHQEMQKNAPKPPIEEPESKIKNALEGYGTASRSFINSMMLGLTDPLVHGTAAAVDNLVSAGFDAKDAADFVSKATNWENFKKAYQEDIDYENKMKEKHAAAGLGGSLTGAFIPAGAAVKVFGGINKAGEAAKALVPAALAAKTPVSKFAAKVGASAVEGAIGNMAVGALEDINKQAQSKIFGTKYEPEGDWLEKRKEEAKLGAMFGGGLTSAIEGAKGLASKYGGKRVAAGAAGLGISAATAKALGLGASEEPVELRKLTPEEKYIQDYIFKKYIFNNKSDL